MPNPKSTRQGAHHKFLRFLCKNRKKRTARLKMSFMGDVQHCFLFFTPQKMYLITTKKQMAGKNAYHLFFYF